MPKLKKWQYAAILLAGALVLGVMMHFGDNPIDSFLGLND